MSDAVSTNDWMVITEFLIEYKTYQGFCSSDPNNVSRKWPLQWAYQYKIDLQIGFLKFATENVYFHTRVIL